MGVASRLATAAVTAKPDNRIVQRYISIGTIYRKNDHGESPRTFEPRPCLKPGLKPSLAARSKPGSGKRNRGWARLSCSLIWAISETPQRPPAAYMEFI